MFSISLVFLLFIILLIFPFINKRNQLTKAWNEKFTLASITEKLLILVKRFPFSIACVFGLTVLFFININSNEYELPYQLWIFFSTGLFINLSTVLFFEDFSNNLKTQGLSLLALLLWATYCYFLPENANDISLTKRIELFVFGGAAFLSLLFVSFLKKNKEHAFWNFATNTLFQLIIAYLFGGILFGGLSLAILAINTLFGVLFLDEIYFNLLVVCFQLFSPLYFLANIPSKTEKEINEVGYSTSQKILSLYILTPILVVYTLILYAYLFKIIFIWELPNGWVSWLVTALAFGGLLVISLFFPIREYENNKVINFITHWIGILILPLLVLMSIGIFRRIGDYGITINRMYVLLLNIWLYGIYLYLFITKSRKIKWILISIVLLAVGTSISSFGTASFTKKWMSKRINLVLQQPLPLEEAQEVFSQLSQKEKEQIKSTLEYLHKNFGRESVQVFFTDSISNNYWSFLSESGLSEVLKEKYESISYYSDPKKIWKVETYSNFTRIDYYPYHTSNKSKVDRLSTGEQVLIDVVVDSKTFSIPVDEFVSKYLDTEVKLRSEKDWIIRGEDFTLLLKGFQGDYYPEKDSIYVRNLEGYLFYEKKSEF